MTKKDYINAAERVRKEVTDYRAKVQICDFLCQFFHADNGRFRTAQFVEACGLDDRDLRSPLVESRGVIMNAIHAVVTEHNGLALDNPEDRAKLIDALVECLVPQHESENETR